MDITKVRPRVVNLRARAIDDERQMIFWDAPIGGRLVGYDIRVRVSGKQEKWSKLPLDRVNKSDSYHSTVIVHGPIDPQEIVVSVRGVNEHRHSDPSPETHLASDYKWLMTDIRHGEPRRNKDPKRPHLAMSNVDSSEFSENMLDWAVDHTYVTWWNITLEEMLHFTHKRLPQTSGRLFRLRGGTSREGSETTELPSPVNALLDGPMGEPDLFVLTATQRSSMEMSISVLEVEPDEAPRWAELLESAGDEKGYGRIADRQFLPFGRATPGSWGLATRFVALHRSGDKSWLEGYEEFAVKAIDECSGETVVGGTVLGNLQALCYSQGNSKLVVHLEAPDGSDLRSWTLRPNAQAERSRSASTQTALTTAPSSPNP